MSALGLLAVVGRVRVDEGGQPGELVALQRPGGHDQDGREQGQPGDQRDVARVGLRHQQHRHGDGDEDRRRPQVRLGHHDEQGDGHEPEGADETGEGQVLTAVAGHVGRQHQDEGDLGQLRRLQLERPDDEPGPGAVAGLGEDGHGQQQDGGGREEQQRPLPQAPVVDDGGHHHHRHRSAHEEGLALGVVVGVQAAEAPRRAGGGIDGDEADRAEAGHREEDAPVEAPGRDVGPSRERDRRRRRGRQDRHQSARALASLMARQLESGIGPTGVGVVAVLSNGSLWLSGASRLGSPRAA